MQATKSRTEVVEYLCSLDGMNEEFINRQTSEFGQFALWMACYYNHVSIAKILIENGANVNLSSHVCFVFSK